MNDYTEFSTINETGDSINEKVKTTFKLNLSSFKLYLKEKKWIFEIYHDEYGIRGIRQKYINGSNTKVNECGDTKCIQTNLRIIRYKTHLAIRTLTCTVT